MGLGFLGGCCCDEERFCVIRCLDFSGDQLWTWKGHNLWRGSSGFRPEGFSVNSAGYVVHCGGTVEFGSLGLIDSDGVTVWDSPVGFETTAFYYPAIDDLNNVYAISRPVSSTVRVHCFDTDGEESWQHDFTSSAADSLFGCFSNGTETFVTWKKSLVSGFSTWTVTCLDSSGSVLGEADYGPATLKLSSHGSIGIDAAGNVIVPYFNYPGGGSGGGVDILDTTCSVVDNHTVTMTSSSGVANTPLSCFGIGELSDGHIALMTFERTGTTTNRCALWDATDNALRFVPTYATGSSSTMGVISGAFSGNGSIFFMEKLLASAATKLVNHSNESGVVQFRVTETNRFPEIPSGGVYNGYLVACNADRIFVASTSNRYVKGWTLDSP